jgi:uncharacterized protein with PIN domain
MDLCFATDRTLGKLAKWLRILGFDTTFESGISNQRFYERLEPERILLTRTAANRDRFAGRKLVFIEADRVRDQLCQVIGDLAITRRDIHLFSICLQCNSPIVKVGKPDVYGQVPDYTWQTHAEFSKCRRCNRIYWAGSHVERSRAIIEKLFNTADI